MKICAIHDGKGCGWYRVSLPMTQMASHGHDVTFVDQNSGEVSSYLKGEHGEFDVFTGQRFIGYDGLSTWRNARTVSSRLVYENDDDIFNVALENYAAYLLFGQPAVREAIRAYCESADLITVTTPVLAEAFTEEVGNNARVEVLPNYIPEYVLGLPRTERERPRVGWAGGASHGRDVHVATKAVRRFLQRKPDWDLFLGGTDYRPSFNAKNWDQMIYGDWVQVNEDPKAFYQSIDFDIGICPVLDTRFAQSKSALKALEMNARGIPVIASDIAPYRDYIRDGENGFLVNHEHEWLARLMELSADENLRREMGIKARAIAAEHTIEKNWWRWERTYASMFGGRK